MRAFCAAFCCLCFTACAVHVDGQGKQTPPGQIKKESAPGQVMHKTGCNPASGKCKDR